MKAKLFWAIQHTKRGIHDLRFAAACWWLSQQVDFFERRSRLEALMPPPQPMPVPVPVRQRNRYAVRVL